LYEEAKKYLPKVHYEDIEVDGKEEKFLKLKDDFWGACK